MIVIKIGGTLVNHLPSSFFEYVKQMQSDGEKIIIVHGGGNLISECSQFVGIKPQKIDGIRVTSPSLIDLTQTVLSKIIQPMLGKQFVEHGIDCQMMNQNETAYLTGTYLNQAKYGEVGQVTDLTPTGWQQLEDPQKVSLFDSLAVTNDGNLLNVNADSAAESLAELVHADKLILLTDVPGIIDHQHVLKQVDHCLAQQLIDKQVLVSGMLPKVAAAFTAIQKGVGQVIITDDLKKTGTTIVA